MANNTNVITITGLTSGTGTGWFITDNKSGVDLNNPQTINLTTNPEVPGFRQTLGTRGQGNSGSEWVLVMASTTVSQNSLVAIDVNYSCNPLTTTLASSNVYTYGVCQIGNVQATNCQPGDAFWALLRAQGGATVNVVSTAARGAQLYISTTQPGALTTTVSGTAVKGIFANTSLVLASLFVDVVMPSYITTSV